jgi:hypothetical protein
VELVQPFRKVCTAIWETSLFFVVVTLFSTKIYSVVTVRRLLLWGKETDELDAMHVKAKLTNVLSLFTLIYHFLRWSVMDRPCELHIWISTINSNGWLSELINIKLNENPLSFSGAGTYEWINSRHGNPNKCIFVAFHCEQANDRQFNATKVIRWMFWCLIH